MTTSVPAELERKMDEAIGHYPAEQKRSAALPLMHLWQEHFGYISDDGVNWIAARLDLEPINILELVTFYPMFRQAPTGRKHIRVCRTLSCAMAGAYPLMEKLAALANIDRPTSGDAQSVAVVGRPQHRIRRMPASCDTAPVCMVDDGLHENVAANSAEDLSLRAVKHMFRSVVIRAGEGLKQPGVARVPLRHAADQVDSAVDAIAFPDESPETIHAPRPPLERFDFPKHRAGRLHHRHRLLPAKRRLQAAQGRGQNEPLRNCERGQELRTSRSRRRRFSLRREVELH